MGTSFVLGGNDGAEAARPSPDRNSPGGLTDRFSGVFDGIIDAIAPSPWPAHASPYHADALPRAVGARPVRAEPPLYTPDERRRRDASGWTVVQGILAPLQFLVFAVSLGLVVRYLVTGRGYEIATISILIKTAALYTIMITGSIWEKEVFGKWLFAHSFFWEDAFSMIVLALQTAYVLALINGWGTPQQQMMIAVAAYLTYVVNATQFVLKLRAARRQGEARVGAHAVDRHAP